MKIVHIPNKIGGSNRGATECFIIFSTVYNRIKFRTNSKNSICIIFGTKFLFQVSTELTDELQSPNST